MKAPTLHLWCALILPIVAFAGLVVRAELLRAAGRRYFTSPLQDTIHEICYKVTICAIACSGRQTGPAHGATCYLCLQTSGAHTKVECGAVNAVCDAQLSHQMVEQGREFFIQEDAGPALEQAIRRGQGTMVLNVAPNGQVQVHELFIDGVPHRRWLRDNAPCSGG